LSSAKARDNSEMPQMPSNVYKMRKRVGSIASPSKEPHPNFGP